MSECHEVNYGPLNNLIGEWKGERGLDVAPKPNSLENNPYFETIRFEAAGDVKNAQSQKLAVVFYRQIVQRCSDNEKFHDETGYWMWDEEAGIVMHSLAIPRAVCVLAGGKHSGLPNNDGQVVLEVSAAIDDSDWTLVQSPFMQEHARTTAFKHQMIIGQDTLSYTETTTLEIYGKNVDHTDGNELFRV